MVGGLKSEGPDSKLKKSQFWSHDFGNPERTRNDQVENLSIRLGENVPN